MIEWEQRQLSMGEPVQFVVKWSEGRRELEKQFGTADEAARFIWALGKRAGLREAFAVAQNAYHSGDDPLARLAEGVERDKGHPRFAPDPPPRVPAEVTDAHWEALLLRGIVGARVPEYFKKAWRSELRKRSRRAGLKIHTWEAARAGDEDLVHAYIEPFEYFTRGGEESFPEFLARWQEDDGKTIIAEYEATIEQRGALSAERIDEVIRRLTEGEQ